MAKKQSALDKLLGRNKPEPEPIQFEPEQEEPQVEEFMEIGGSPVPGTTLQHVLEGHTSRINFIAWSPNGSFLASPSNDNTIRIWDTATMNCIKVLREHDDIIQSIAWSPDSSYLACGGAHNFYLWNIRTGSIINKVLQTGSYDNTVAWSPDGKFIAHSAGKYLRIVDAINQTAYFETEFPNFIFSITWKNSRVFAVSGMEGDIELWDVVKKVSIGKLEGHKNTVTTEKSKGLSFLRSVNSIVWLPNSEILASGGNDGTVRIWNTDTMQLLTTLEGHTDRVQVITFSYNGKIIASKGADHSIRLITTYDWNVIGKILENSEKIHLYSGLAFHPQKPILATLGKNNTAIRVWHFEFEKLLSNENIIESVRYTTAKLVLVGDSGVGKTGLGWRLAHNDFKEHSSTHGQQFWVVPELKKTREDGTECEAVLWDLAGQHIYRSIHSIFLDDVDASLILFDPTNRQEPLKGAQFWLEQLKGKKQLPPSVLVGARLDRGAPVLSQQELDQFCQKYGVSGGYIGTSAKSGEGLDKLVGTLKDQIPWDQMTTTVTTVTFKRIKEFVLSLKEKPDRKGVLIKPDDLQVMLVATDETWDFTDAEMMTAVGHLANHGYVTILHSSSGEEYILLVPELLASVAASIFLHADKHPRELGAINETELLQGKYPIEEFKELEKEEQQVLLDATVVRFLEHSICFRETLITDSLLIFPSLIKQKRPLKDDVPITDDTSYIVRGRVENIYSVLVVLLGYTPSFNRVNQWQNQVQYETEAGNICGFRLVEDREGEIELILYYGNEMPEDERNDFQSLFEQFLFQREVEVVPFPPVICPNGHRQERAIVVKRSQEGKKSIFCDECGARTDLPEPEAQPAFDFEVSDWLKREEATARLRGVYETHLVRVKGYRRGWATPRCYISYAVEQKEFAERLAHDLADAGIFVVDEPIKVESTDNIIVIDSASYKKAWENNTIQNEIKLIRPRLADIKHKGLVYINQTGAIFEHNIKKCVSKSFCDPTHYVINLFDLVLNLYAIPLNQAGFGQLRQNLHQQWEQTLAPRVVLEAIADSINPNTSIQREIYVSYAWGGESEKLVNEIDQAFLKKGVTITRDKRDLGYRGSIKEFMERIGRGKSIVVVLSDKYLRSKNCMFELLQIAENRQFKDRIFPVVLSDANIYESIKRIEYIKHWETKKKELNKAMKGVSAEHLQGIREEIDLFDDIRDEIAELTNVLQDMNTLTPEMHRDSNFQTLFDAVMAKLEE